jgi:DNA-binding LytR/AlgR family response regulator
MITCIAVDDEPLALDLLEDNIRHIPFLHLVARCKNAFEAIEILQKEKIDLIFLDIQMPGIIGTELIASLPHKPIVVFVTAYEKYAYKGFELDAIDYLIKPVPFGRFLKAAQKAFDYLKLQQGPVYEKRDYIFIHSEYSLVKVKFDEILYIEGLKDYIKIYSVGSSRPLLTRMSMKAVEDLLPQGDFIRVHKSFIISMDKVISIRKNRIRIASMEVPISSYYRENLKHILGKEAPENNASEPD